ncbi:MAG: metal-dependent hydrolase [Elusimicrobiota bacterium]|nr:MAG: metal-dependent hydrolase [Elusimicrobiota bacterium]
MASLFGHVAAAAAIGQAAPAERRKDWRFWYMAAMCACLPDADVAGFRFGIRYEDLWGHRGMTHSLVFAAAVGALAAARFKPDWRKEGWKLAALFAAITASHGFLDALTNGGHGVAFFSPFDAARYFFPWTPIQVSPIGAKGFFSAKGLAVIVSELKWIGVPALIAGAALRSSAKP